MGLEQKIVVDIIKCTCWHVGASGDLMSLLDVLAGGFDEAWWIVELAATCKKHEGKLGGGHSMNKWECWRAALE